MTSRAPRWIAAAGLAFLAVSPAGSQSPEPPPGSLPRPVERIVFHHYEIDLPISEGWELATRAPEQEAISIRLFVGEGENRFKQAELGVARAGAYEVPAAARQPEAVFQALADAELARARRDIADHPGIEWLGAQRDTVVDTENDHVFHRLWYGISTGRTRADAWVVFLFPPDFRESGAYLRVALQNWSQPRRQDPWLIEEFQNVLRSIRLREPTMDTRVIAAGADSESDPQPPLPLAYYDARKRATGSALDSTKTICWTQLADTLAVGFQATVVPGVRFFSFAATPPAEGHDLETQRFGKAMDRDEDGRLDLVFLNQGIGRAEDGRLFRTFYVVADDDGDGLVDGIVFEDGDIDENGLVDHGVFVQDRARAGEPDRAWIFNHDIAHPIRPATHTGPIFQFKRASRSGEAKADMAHEFAAWNYYLTHLNEAFANCARSGS